MKVDSSNKGIFHAIKFLQVCKPCLCIVYYLNGIVCIPHTGFDNYNKCGLSAGSKRRCPKPDPV